MDAPLPVFVTPELRRLVSLQLARSLRCHTGERVIAYASEASSGSATSSDTITCSTASRALFRGLCDLAFAPSAA